MGSLWPRSGTIERYADDIRAAGAKAYFYQGGTTTPLTVYRDSGEGESHTFPVLADANGRWPNIFIPYSGTGYDVQVKTTDNVQLTYTLSVPNPDPIAVVAPPAVDGVTTGMIHAELTNSTKSGYVRLNGRTIGNAISGGTERANADTASLFGYLWNGLSDAIAPVSGGRGASSVADYAANKSITLPSCRGTVLMGLDDMGNTAAGAFAGITFASGNATTAGSVAGANTYTLSLAQMPAHTHTGATLSAGAHTHGGVTGIQSADHTHSGTTDGHSHTGSTNLGGAHNHTINAVQSTTSQFSAGGNNVGSGPLVAGAVTSTHTGHLHGFTTDSGTDTFTSGIQSANHTHTISSDGVHTHIFTTDSTGGATAVNNLPLSRLVTWFIKL